MSVPELDALVAGNVRAHRAKRRLTQQELADEMGWSRASLLALENESRRVTLSDVVDLCRALDIPLVELVRGAPVEALQYLGLSEA
jgi:transcriptional regulator with XRE-family HTH domain